MKQPNETILFGTEDQPVRVRVPGAQVSANKRDGGDRPCILAVQAGRELLVHEVRARSFPSPLSVRIAQDFQTGCPVTGALIWIELLGEVVLTVREDTRDERPADWRVDANAKPASPVIGVGGRR